MKILYEFETREALHAQVIADGKIIIHENITDLDENGRPTNCFVIAEDAPPAEQDESTDLQAYFDGMTEVLENE